MLFVLAIRHRMISLVLIGCGACLTPLFEGAVDILIVSQSIGTFYLSIPLIRVIGNLTLLVGIVCLSFNLGSRPRDLIEQSEVSE